MDAELRQVANGFDYKVRSFDKYDINGYRFRTYGKELSMADRKSTNCCVSAIGEGGTEYYGRVEAIWTAKTLPSVADGKVAVYRSQRCRSLLPSAADGKGLCRPLFMPLPSAMADGKVADSCSEMGWAGQL